MGVSEKKKLILHSNFRAFRDYLVTMLPLALLSTYVYGRRVAVMFLIATVLAYVCDIACQLLMFGRYDVTELSSLAFSWTFTMLMPASVNFFVLSFGILFVILLGKYAFGGYGKYPFHPVAFGYALCAVSFPEQIFSYPAAYETVDMSGNAAAVLYRSPAYYLLKGETPSCSVMDLITGNFAGPLGSMFAAVAFSCMFLMIVHKAINWQTPLFFITTCALWSFAFPRVPGSRLSSVLLELVSGGIPFAAAYLLAEPTLTPENKIARQAYGIVTGIVTMLITRFGYYEYGVCFALLLAGPVSDRIDRLFSSDIKKLKKEVTADEQKQ